MRCVASTVCVMSLLLLAAACGGSDSAMTLSPSVGPTPPTTRSASPVKTSSPGDVTPPATPCIRDNTGCTPQTSGFGELTAEQGTLAKAIAQRDPTLRSLLADKTYTLGYGRWELSGELVGAIMTIGLDQTIYVDANLPSVDVGYRGGPPATYVKLPPPYYVETTAHFTIEAQYFAVIVDFSREKVIYIRPDPPGSLGVS